MQFTAGVAVLGCGTVGTEVARRLIAERDVIARRAGIHFELRAIAVRDRTRSRPPEIDPALFARDARSVVDDPAIDVIVECVGGTGDAFDLVERALDRGRHVVTANKDLLATQGPRLRALAAARGASLRYEAAACGAIPVVRTIDDALAGDEIRAFAGVFNGTTTAMLSAMESGASFDDALREAQRLGYAEADPTNDLDGSDAAHKLALLMQLAYGLAVISPRIRRDGIAHVPAADVRRAAHLGLRIRLIAATARDGERVEAEVAPVLVPRDHPFARTSGAENAVRVLARDAGALSLGGHGAGGRATASAVLGDVVSALRAIGERHDLALHMHGRALLPAIDVAPFFASRPHHHELPRYVLWDDTFLEAPAAHDVAYSSPGKDHLS